MSKKAVSNKRSRGPKTEKPEANEEVLSELQQTIDADPTLFSDEAKLKVVLKTYTDYRVPCGM